MAYTDTLARPVRRTAGRFGAALSTRLAVWRSRRALAMLDARGLADIGLDRDAALREARKGAWDVPETWRRP